MLQNSTWSNLDIEYLDIKYKDTKHSRNVIIANKLGIVRK